MHAIMERAAFGRQRRQSLRGHVNMRLVRMRLVHMRSRISGAYGQSHAYRHSCNYRFRHDRNLLGGATPREAVLRLA
jgi:hypothetical protein